jgi:hypothetical protein
MNASTGMRRSIPALAATTVLLIMLGVVWLVRDTGADAPVSPGNDGAPPVLRLADYQPTTAGSEPDDGYRLTGDLPDGPSDASVRRLTTASDADIRSLAQSLGFDGAGRSESGATTYGSDSATLRVQDADGGEWQYVDAASPAPPTACPPHAVGGDDNKGMPDAYVVCDQAPVDPTTSNDEPQDTTGTTATAAPPPDQALAVARPVLEAVGLDPAHSRTIASVVQATVVADPVVDDLPTSGLATTVTVVGDKVAAAGGFAGGSRAADSYPVVTAREAWRTLQRTPLPQTLVACPEPLPDNADPRACGGPVVVTGANFGLSLQHTSGGAVLVPSWLFEVRNSADPIAVVAVDPDFLAPATAGGGSDPGVTESPNGGSTPGSPTPGLATPGPVSPEPPSPASRFQTVTLSQSSDALIARFTGGVEACYNYRVVARETPTRVYLSLVEKVASNKRCIEMAQVYDRRVELKEPLGARQVLDGETGSMLLGPSR